MIMPIISQADDASQSSNKKFVEITQATPEASMTSQLLYPWTSPPTYKLKYEFVEIKDSYDTNYDSVSLNLNLVDGQNNVPESFRNGRSNVFPSIQIKSKLKPALKSLLDSKGSFTLQINELIEPISGNKTSAITIVYPDQHTEKLSDGITKSNNKLIEQARAQKIALANKAKKDAEDKKILLAQQKAKQDIELAKAKAEQAKIDLIKYNEDPRSPLLKKIEKYTGFHIEEDTHPSGNIASRGPSLSEFCDSLNLNDIPIVGAMNPLLGGVRKRHIEKVLVTFVDGNNTTTYVRSNDGKNNLYCISPIHIDTTEIMKNLSTTVASNSITSPTMIAKDANKIIELNDTAIVIGGLISNDSNRQIIILPSNEKPTQVGSGFETK